MPFGVLSWTQWLRNMLTSLEFPDIVFRSTDFRSFCLL